MNCIRCGTKDCKEADVSEVNGFCGHCLCDYINHAREFHKTIPDVTDMYILMAEFAALKVSSVKTVDVNFGKGNVRRLLNTDLDFGGRNVSD